MQKKLRITVEGRSYIVTVEELSEHGVAVPLNPVIAGTGASTTATTTPLAPPPAPSRAAPPPPAQPGDEISPLGGVVDSVEVAVGQAVRPGDKLAVVEAMKMKTPIFAQLSGTVTAVHVRPGDGVEAGQALVTIG